MPNICILSLNQDIYFIHQELCAPTIEVDSNGLQRAGAVCEDTSPSQSQEKPAAGRAGQAAKNPGQDVRGAPGRCLHAPAACPRPSPPSAGSLLCCPPVWWPGGASVSEGLSLNGSPGEEHAIS